MNSKDKISSLLGLVSLFFYLFLERPWMLYLAITLLLIHNFIPFFDHYVKIIWLKFSHIIGQINSKIILTLIYYLFLTPMAFIRRIGKNPLWITKPSVDTYWKERNTTYTKENLTKGW